MNCERCGKLISNQDSPKFCTECGNLELKQAKPPEGESMSESSTTSTNIAALKVAYPFFVIVLLACIILSDSILNSLYELLGIVLPTIIVGYFIYTYKPGKDKKYYERKLRNNRYDVASLVASEPKAYGNITKGEYTFLLLVVIVLPAAIGFLTFKNWEKFFFIAFIIGFLGAFIGIMAISIKRSIKP